MRLCLQTSILHFRRKHFAVKQLYSLKTIRKLLHFPSNYLRESAFSRYSMTEAKYRTKVCAKEDLKVAAVANYTRFQTDVFTRTASYVTMRN